MATSGLVLTNGLPVTVAAPSPYSESIAYPAGLVAGTTITLPNSGSFTSSAAKDLLVIVNDRIVEESRDFVVVGAGPTYTQIQFNYDLSTNTIVVFRKNI